MPEIWSSNGQFRLMVLELFTVPGGGGRSALAFASSVATAMLSARSVCWTRRLMVGVRRPAKLAPGKTALNDECFAMRVRTAKPGEDP